MKNIIVLIFIAFCFSNCASNQDHRTEIAEKIVSVYFKKTVEKANQSKEAIDIYIEFSQPISEEIELKKIYFRNQEATVKQRNNKEFAAKLLILSLIDDFILDSDSKAEYDNKAPTITKSKFILSSNEAILEYKIKNKKHFFKIINIKERQ